MEMQGRFEEGRSWLREHETVWAEGNGFAGHHWWHLALFHLEAMDLPGALALHDDHQGSAHAVLTLQRLDGAALLWRLRLLAVSGVSRNPIAPDVPTFREQGYPIDLIEWTGIFAPKGTPPAVVQRAGSAVTAVVSQPDFAKFLADLGMAPKTMSPQAFAELIRTETEQWRTDIKKIGFSAES